MGDDHVPVRTGRVVERTAFFDRERLGNVDLHMLDVFAVPDRLEQTVGEAKGEDVLGSLLAQEVIDAKDLVLGEDLVHGRVEQDRGSARSVPKGFSMMMRARSVSSASASILTTAGAATGGMLR